MISTPVEKKCGKQSESHNSFLTLAEDNQNEYCSGARHWHTRTESLACRRLKRLKRHYIYTDALWHGMSVSELGNRDKAWITRRQIIRNPIQPNTSVWRSCITTVLVMWAVPWAYSAIDHSSTLFRACVIWHGDVNAALCWWMVVGATNINKLFWWRGRAIWRRNRKMWNLVRLPFEKVIGISIVFKEITA